MAARRKLQDFESRVDAEARRGLERQPSQIIGRMSPSEAAVTGRVAGAPKSMSLTVPSVPTTTFSERHQGDDVSDASSKPFMMRMGDESSFRRSPGLMSR